jgi:hypothetical protein
MSRPFLRMVPLLAAALAAAGLRAQPAPAEAASDADILRQFEIRREETLERATGHVERKAVDGRFTVAADFYSRTWLDWANATFLKAYSQRSHDDVDMFWMYPLVTDMEAGRGGMSAANQAHVRELWRTMFPKRGDTENHWLLYYASLCLAAEANPDAGPEAWFNGKSSARNIAEARAYIEDWIRITTSYGQGEFDSPNYLEAYTAPLALLAGWERDPRFRQEARMMLDYLFYDYASEQLNGEYGGAHSRIYPSQVVQPGDTPAAGIGWLLFGLGEYRAGPAPLILSMSGYTPPPILYRIAHDRSRPFVTRELKRTRWRMRHPGPDAFAVGGKSTVPVYKYTYMAPDFVIGSCQGGLLQPIQQQTWSLIWREGRTSGRENYLTALQPYSSPFEGTMYFPGQWDTTTYLIAYSGPVAKADYDSPDKVEGGSPYEQVFQAGPALIGLYDMPADNRFPLVDVLFSRDLTRREPDPSGWIFCQGGPAYFAVRLFAPGEWKSMGWTGLMKANKSWFSAGFLLYGRDNHCLVSPALRNGYVVQAASAREFKSFDAFKAAVRSLPLRFSLGPVPEADFTSLAGARMHARYGSQLTVNGVADDHAHWPLYEGPFGHAERGSRRLDIEYGQEHYLLDFQKVEIDDEMIPAEF